MANVRLGSLADPQINISLTAAFGGGCSGGSQKLPKIGAANGQEQPKRSHGLIALFGFLGHRLCQLIVDLPAKGGKLMAGTF